MRVNGRPGDKWIGTELRQLLGGGIVAIVTAAEELGDRVNRIELTLTADQLDELAIELLTTSTQLRRIA